MAKSHRFTFCLHSALISIDFLLDIAIIAPMPVKFTKSEDVSYKATFDSALAELAEMMAEREELDSKRDEIDTRITRLREAIIGLGGLCHTNSETIATEHPDLFPDRVAQDIGFTDAIRAVFRKHPDFYHSPVWIREALRANGFDVDKYKNVLASIHSILRRLKLKGDILEGSREGKAVFTLNPKGDLAKAPTPFDISDDDVPF
jgi:hypothetical protein